MAIIGQADRSRRWPAEGDGRGALCRGIRSARRRACGAGAKHHRRRHASRRSISKTASGMPGVLAIITPDNAPKLRIRKQARAAGAGAAAAGQRRSVYNGQHVAVVVADTLEQAQAAAARGARAAISSGEPITSMDAVLGPGLCAEAFPQRRAPAGFQPRRSGRRRSTAARCKVDATYITPIEHHNPMEPHATIAALGRRQADGVDRDARHHRRAGDAGRTVRHRPEQMCG